MSSVNVLSVRGKLSNNGSKSLSKGNGSSAASGRRSAAIAGRLNWPANYTLLIPPQK